MAFLYDGRGPLTQIKAEFRRREFLSFVHGGGDLDLAVQMLVMLRVSHTRAEVVQRCGDGAFRMLNFLADQELVRLLKSRREGEALYKAERGAVDDLAHRLEHQGEPIPMSMEDPDEGRRAAARDKVKVALARGQWQGKQKVRLRVVC
jgi:hypothetical protein